MGPGPSGCRGKRRRLCGPSPRKMSLWRPRKFPRIIRLHNPVRVAWTGVENSKITRYLNQFAATGTGKNRGNCDFNVAGGAMPSRSLQVGGRPAASATQPFRRRCSVTRPTRKPTSPLTPRIPSPPAETVRVKRRSRRHLQHHKTVLIEPQIFTQKRSISFQFFHTHTPITLVNVHRNLS